MNSHAFNRSLLLNTLWSFLGRFGYIFIALISNIILVRLLSPREFGQVSIIMFFIVVSNILIESGLSGALVRKKDATEVDYSTVFIFNMAISLILMISLFLSSSYIADFYKDSELTNLLKLSSLVLIINALRLTQSVKLIKSLKFKEKSIYEIISIVIGSILAIVSAMQGFGATSLVILQLATAITLTSLLWFSVGPMSTYKFSKSSFKQVYKFGVNTTLASLINKTFDNGYQLILAKYFSISQSGYFYQAKKLQEMPVGIIQSSVLGVVYATLSKLQDNKPEFNQVYFNVVRIFTIVVALICILLYYYSGLIIQVLYGDQWLASVHYLQLLSIASFFYLQEIFNRVLFKIFDRTELILKLEIIKKLILSITIFYGVWTLSIPNLLYGFVAVSILSFLINYHFARKVHLVSYWRELSIILKVVIISIVTTASALYVQYKFNIDGLYTLFSLPLILILFFALLNLVHVINLKTDYQIIKQLVKKGN